eukprot:GHUV01020537.1.p1 GENE.GHUV01020537.1~~GHUV01020537.1.p1  ORF type:complete len:196 (+),score=31.87 GHUV01020537.1:333-920(+)
MPSVHLRCHTQQCTSGNRTMLAHNSRRTVSCYLLKSHLSTCHVSNLWPSQQQHLHSNSSSSRGAVVAAAAAAQPTASSVLIDWVVANGGSVKGATMANLAGSDGGSGWGLIATEDISKPGTRLIDLPRSCQLSYDESSDPRVLRLIGQVPEELWGAKLALQVGLKTCHWFPHVCTLNCTVSYGGECICICIYISF